MTEIIEFWIKVSLVGVCMAFVIGVGGAIYQFFKDRQK